MGTTKAQHPLVREEPEGQEELDASGVEPPEMRRCRICAGSVQAKAARIFADEGRRRNLQRNIRKYLYISVSSEDRLPKMVCAPCIGKLDGIHAFATMALKTQERLKQELLRTTSGLVVTVDCLDNSDSSLNKLGDRGLLHSILTKGSVELSDDTERVQGRQRTPSTEEMEVKVDPMLFLQCALEQPSSIDYSDFSEDSDRDANSYCAHPSQPLSLINNEMEKRCDNNENDDLDIIEDGKDAESEEEEDDLENVEDLTNSKVKQHDCKICAKSFSSQIVLQDHLWSHLPTTTSDIRDYVDDATSILRNEKECEGDGALMSQNNSCSENSLLSGNFICPICSKRISTKGNLKVHLETHRPKGKYGCDICGRIFKTHSNLFRHKEYHSGIQFPCGVCGRVYPTNSTLRAHSITHSDLRPHACPLCDKTFKRNQDLKFHINQHTGARPYQCPYCPKAFASSGNCFSHRKRMHPKEVHRDRQRAADLMR
ncbi:PREDICTED: zinc finger protein 771-like [Ceratosolen solmsi marchali]|uniref:Zinc finger protein 771-like n=1 Tax=Ceratosolen solmsi marchali TaxID=326594 RepID=A0AAJ6YTZ3_9HYME|nr:PREDICTED: zinc finger protein 771-like [Ceratosolen solmsi marchali]